MTSSGFRGHFRIRSLSYRAPAVAIRDRDARPAPDLVNRSSSAGAPNKLWVTDSTHVTTDAGFPFPAVALDAYSRRIPGWDTCPSMHRRLILDVLDMAIAHRRAIDVLHQSSQGAQYTCVACGSRCREAGSRPPMGSVGDRYDNTMCESFNAALECELLDKQRFRSHHETELAIFELGGWYNLHRGHSALGH